MSVTVSPAVRVEAAPTDRPPGSWQHLPALDGLRALAVTAVLLFHAGHLQGGFLGVDLFFALSGFLITSLLIRDAQRGGIRISTFWGRRFRRLLPAVFMMIAVIALSAWAFGSPAELTEVRRDGPWTLAYVANWHFIAEAEGYWASFSQPSMFDHLWSLAIEEQFYVLWPLVLLAVWWWARRPERALLVVCAAGIALSFATMLLLDDGGDPTRLYMGTDTRAASLLAGGLAATPPVRRIVATLVARLGRWTAVVVAGVGALVLWSWTAVDGATSATLYRGGLLLHSAACAFIVVVVSSAPTGVAARSLGWRPLAWIGLLSYSLYLWHWPVYVALSPERTGIDGVALTAVRIAVATVCAVLSYRLVENPIRYRAQWVRGRRGLPALAGAVTAVAIVLAILPTTTSEIARFDPASVAVAAPAPTAIATTTAPPTTAARSSPTPAPSASVAPPAVAAEALPSTTSAPTTTIAPTTSTTALRPPIVQALWAGDSLAFDLSPAVGAALTAAGVPVDLGSAFVGYRVGPADEESDLVESVRDKIDSIGVDVVILQLPVWDWSLDPAEQLLTLTRFRDVVLGRGARVVFVGAPIVGHEPTNEGQVTMSAAARELSAADPEHVLYVDPSVVWGSEPALDADDDGAPERKRDHIHVCPSGAARFAAWLTGELATHFAGVSPAPPADWAAGEWVVDERYNDPEGACAAVT